MSKIENTLKKGVIDNKAYTLKPIECPIKLNQNESPFDLPDQIKQKIVEKLNTKRWNIYPDFTPLDIYEKIAKYLNVNTSNILLGNGSNEMIFTILSATCETGRNNFV